ELSNLKRFAIAEELPITFLGWQTKIESVLGVCDLLMSTSINEGTPVSLIQAQMAGKPVLATNVGSSSEVLLHQQTGFCLDYSKDAFANVIKEMSVNPNLCRELGMQAKNFALQNFATKRLIEDHAN
ncbi:MAG: glycosyltransferase, partial [bacterium]